MNDHKLTGQHQLAPIIHQVGMSGAAIGCTSFCANCWPKQEPAFMVWAGFSLCHQCVTPLRQKFDLDKSLEVPSLVGRDYKETWGEDPEVE